VQKLREDVHNVTLDVANNLQAAQTSHKSQQPVCVHASRVLVNQNLLHPVCCPVGAHSAPPCDRLSPPFSGKPGPQRAAPREEEAKKGQTKNGGRSQLRDGSAQQEH
jgi:hypothetical protein